MNCKNKLSFIILLIKHNHSLTNWNNVHSILKLKITELASGYRNRTYFVWPLSVLRKGHNQLNHVLAQKWRHHLYEHHTCLERSLVAHYKANCLSLSILSSFFRVIVGHISSFHTCVMLFVYKLVINSWNTVHLKLSIFQKRFVGTKVEIDRFIN